MKNSRANERYKSGESRNLITFLPPCIDDYVDENNIVRAICAYADSLNMKELGFTKSVPKATGCFAYSPKDMLKLYIYGYLNRITSSRALEKESKRNIEVMWLLNKLTPDDRTICNFRKENSQALKNTFIHFSKMLCSLGMYGKETIILDGSRFRANCNSGSSINDAQVSKKIKEIDDKIARYFSECDTADAESAELNELQNSKEKLQALMDRIQNEVAVSNSLGKKEINLIDKDARLMKQGNTNEINTGYNIQTVVDAKHTLITDFEVTNSPADGGTLYKMAKRTKEILKADELTLLADKGYCESTEIRKCDDDGITCLIARPELSAEDGVFGRKDFYYDACQDIYVCPKGHSLPFKRESIRHGQKQTYFNTKACKNCDWRDRCKTKIKCIHRHIDEEFKKKADRLSKENPDLFKKRKQIEHTFGATGSIGQEALAEY
jgi:transposase